MRAEAPALSDFYSLKNAFLDSWATFNLNFRSKTQNTFFNYCKLLWCAIKAWVVGCLPS